MLLSIVLFVTTVTTSPVPTNILTDDGPTSCVGYPDNYFFNDKFTCQGYFYCANNNSQPSPGTCLKPYNFDQENQQCSHPDIHPCHVSFGGSGGKSKIFIENLCLQLCRLCPPAKFISKMLVKIDIDAETIGLSFSWKCPSMLLIFNHNRENIL